MATIRPGMINFATPGAGGGSPAAVGQQSVLSSIRPSGAMEQSAWTHRPSTNAGGVSFAATGVDTSNQSTTMAKATLAQSCARALDAPDALPHELAFRLRKGKVTPEEQDLWHLCELLFEDSCKTYDAAAININSVAPSRRWAISQHTLAQDLLHRSTVIRRLTVVLRWLEQSASKHLEVHQLGKAAKSQEELQLLFENVFKLIRSGNHTQAKQLALMAEHPILSSTLMGTPLRRAREQWQGRAETVPLFGEYNSEPQTAGEWVSNDHRMALLSTLYDTAKERTSADQDAVAALDSAICGALSGYIPAMSHVFDAQPNWKDKLWCEVRGRLVHVLAKTHSPYTNAAASASFLDAIELSCGATGGTWIPECERFLQQEVIRQIKQMMQPAGGVEALNFVDKLQMRLILLFLSDGDNHEVFDLPNLANSTEQQLRIVANLMVLLDVEEAGGYLRTGPHDHPEQFVAAIVAHLQQTLLGAEGCFEDSDTICELALPYLGRIRDPSTRARAYTALLQVARARHAAIDRAPGALERIEEEEAAVLRHMKVREMDRWGGAAILEEVLKLLSCSTTLVAEELITEGLAPVGSRHNTTTFEDEQAGAADAAGGAPAMNFTRLGSVGMDITNQTILTHHADSEALSWLSRTDDERKLPAVFQLGLESMLKLWQQGEHEAVRDAVFILARRVLPRWTPLPSEVEEQFAFWDAAVNTHQLQIEYEKVAAEIRHEREAAVVRAGSRKTKLSDLEVREEAMRVKMHEHIEQCFSCSSSVKEEVASVMSDCLQSYTELCILAVGVLPTTPDLAKQTLLPPFKLLSVFEGTGRMDEELQVDVAKSLSLAMRTLRATYSQRLHDDGVALHLSNIQKTTPDS